MPIYAYKCESCGQSRDVLQKISDPLLTVCPFCSQPTFVKQVTAAGFQLKGSGWYATDFKGGTTAASAPAGAASAEGKSGADAGGSADAKSPAPAKPVDAPAKKADSAPTAAAGSGIHGS
ncbi:MAG: zinc ribbon domain-containing protein [Pseudomonadota bacterium]